MIIKNKRKGFSLIELLVVISIIGVLATIVFGSLNDARSRARDSKRLLDIKTIQNELELFAIANNGVYPSGIFSSNDVAEWENLENILGKSLPTDPSNTGSDIAWRGNYTYTYFSSRNAGYCQGRAYLLAFNLENKNGNGPNDGVLFCSGGKITHGNTFVVGVGDGGNIVTPDLSGS